MTAKYGLQFVILVAILQEYSLTRHGLSKNGKHHQGSILKRDRGSRTYAKKGYVEVQSKADKEKAFILPGDLTLSNESNVRKKSTKSRPKLTRQPDNNTKKSATVYRHTRRHQLSLAGRQADPSRKAIIQGQRTFENSVMLENWKEKNQHSITRNLKRAKKVFSSRPSIRSVKIVHARSFSSGMRLPIKTRKSDITKETHVHGHSGSLHVHAALDETTLVSKNGDLDLFIKNPGSDETESNSKGDDNEDPDFVPKDHSNFEDSEVQPERRELNSRNNSKFEENFQLIETTHKDTTGLRRPKVSRDIHGRLSSPEHLCVVPPCTT